MAFPPKLLNDGEEVILDLRPHWLFMALSSGVFMVVLVLGGLLALQWSLGGLPNTIVDSIVAIAFVASLCWVALTYARWVTTMFVLTTDRIISRHGVVSKSGTDIPLERVNTVFFSQGVLERMVGAGDLTVESAGERGSNVFSNIRQPNVVQKEIYTQIEANENRKFDRMRGPVSESAAPEPSIPEQIDQLSELHQRGVLSDAEFARKKAELLDRM